LSPVQIEYARGTTAVDDAKDSRSKIITWP
jgi:hypothetical protein